MDPTPTTSDGLPYRRADFATLVEGLDHAARGADRLQLLLGARAAGQDPALSRAARARDRLARGLIRAGFPARSRIMLLADTDPDVLALFFACQYAGIDPGAGGAAGGPRRPRGLCRSARPPAQELRRGRGDGAGRAGRFFARCGRGVRIGADDRRPGRLLRPAGRWRRRCGRSAPDDPCYLQYSSGSTRWPLGIDVRQRSLMANAHAIAAHGLEAVPGDRCVSWLPLYHDMGLVGLHADAAALPAVGRLSGDPRLRATAAGLAVALERARRLAVLQPDLRLRPVRAPRRWRHARLRPAPLAGGRDRRRHDRAARAAALRRGVRALRLLAPAPSCRATAWPRRRSR